MTQGTRKTLTDGSPVYDGHAEIDPATGLQRAYVVLADDERAKGFVRPYRDAYRHVGCRPKHSVRDLTDEEKARYAQYGYVKFEVYPESEAPKTGRYWTEVQLNSGCGAITTMSRPLAETYARQPDFYGGTFCSTCCKHFPVGEAGEFTWYEMDGRDGPRVGT